MKKLKYKGFIGKIQYSKYDNILYGRVLNTSDLVSYDGRTVKELEKNFRETVDDYIEICAIYNKVFTPKLFNESRMYIAFKMLYKFFTNEGNYRTENVTKLFVHKKATYILKYDAIRKKWFGKAHNSEKSESFVAKSLSHAKKKFNHETKNVVILRKRRYITLPRKTEKDNG